MRVYTNITRSFYLGIEAKKRADIIRVTVFCFNWRHPLLTSDARIKLSLIKHEERVIAAVG